MLRKESSSEMNRQSGGVTPLGLSSALGVGSCPEPTTTGLPVEDGVRPSVSDRSS